MTLATVKLACNIYHRDIRIRVTLHIAWAKRRRLKTIFTVVIIQLTGRPPFKYPIHTPHSVPNRPLSLSIPYPFLALCLQTAHNDMPPKPPVT